MIVCGGLLCGDRVPLAKMPARRASYETYRALPHPALIRGRFERGCNAMTDPGVPHDDMLSSLWRSGMDAPQDRGAGGGCGPATSGHGAEAHGFPAQQAMAFTPRPGHTPAGKHKGKGKAASR